MKRLVSGRVGLSMLFTAILFTVAAFLLPHPKYKSPVFGQQEENKNRKILFFSSSQVSLDNLPIKIKGFKNLSSKEWIKDLKIYLENVSDKPVYLVRLHLSFPDVTTPQGIYGFSMYYGDRRLRVKGELAGTDDKPIPPGEIISIKIPDMEAEGLRMHLSRSGFPESATDRIELAIESISFGDGTGILLVEPKSNEENVID